MKNHILLVVAFATTLNIAVSAMEPGSTQSMAPKVDGTSTSSVPVVPTLPSVTVSPATGNVTGVVDLPGSDIPAVPVVVVGVVPAVDQKWFGARAWDAMYAFAIRQKNSAKEICKDNPKIVTATVTAAVVTAVGIFAIKNSAYLRGMLGLQNDNEEDEDWNDLR